MSPHSGLLAGRILAEAGPTISIPDAAKVLGISRGTAYAHAKSGTLAGVRVLSLGSRRVLPTAELRSVVGLDKPKGKGAA